MLATLFERFQSAGREHGYLDFVEPNQVIDEDTYSCSPIRAHKHYFELRIPETFLREERSYWKNYAPLTVVMLRFLHNGKTKELPFVISAQSLLANFSGDTQGWSEFHNVRALGPFPYEGDDVELAVALYAVETKDYAGELFALTDKLLDALQVPVASKALETAGILKEAIEQLVDLDKVSRKVGFYQVFQESEQAPRPFRDQYLLKINADDQSLAGSKFTIDNGRLYVEGHNNQRQRFTERDYCLARIRAANKIAYSKLSFWEIWQSVACLVNEGNSYRANTMFVELMRQVKLCSDLTKKDRKCLPFVFKTMFENEKEQYNLLHHDLISGPNYRSGDKAVPQAGASGMQMSALKLHNTNYPVQIHQGLKHLSDEWEHLPCTGSKQSDGKADEIIAQQLDKVNELVTTEAIEPELIADALSLNY